MIIYVVGIHQKHLDEALLMSNYSVCFHGELKNKNINTFWLEKKKSGAMEDQTKYYITITMLHMAPNIYWTSKD